MLSGIQLLEGELEDTVPPPHQWEDITTLLQETADELSVGEVLLSKGFTLYEAMSALELMDPKMDAGMNASNVHNFDEAFQLGEINTSKHLSIQQIIGTMDRLLTFECMWLHGDPISQTLFTCLYLHRPFLVCDDPFLSPFIFALLRRCHALRALIVESDIYEDEDFSRYMFFMDFALKAEKDVFSEITEAENLLLAREKALKTKTLTDYKPLQEDANLEAEFVQALLARIRFSRSWLQTHIHLPKRSVPNAQKTIKFSKQQLEIIAKTAHLGQIATELFQPEIVRRLPTSNHPKKINMIDVPTCVKVLSLMADQLLTVTNLTEYTKFEDLRLAIIRLIHEGAGVVPRSYFMNFSLVGGKSIFGKHDIVDWLMQDAKAAANIPDDYFKFEFVQNFFQTIAKTFCFYLSISAFNKARRRRKLQILFHEWSIVGDQALRVDLNITKHFNLGQDRRSPYFLIWILDKTYQCMIDFLQLGFELELYDQIEYPAIFWYITNLNMWRKSQHHYLLKYDQINPHKSIAPSKKVSKARLDPNKPLTLTPHHYKILAEFELSNSILQYILALQIDYKMPNNLHYKDEKNRWMTRFEPFFQIGTPQPFGYEQFEKELNAATNAETLVKTSDEASKASKAHLEKLLTNKTGPAFKQEELKAMQKVGVSNNVYMSMTKKKMGVGKVANHHINYDFTTHPYYPIISLVANK